MIRCSKAQGMHLTCPEKHKHTEVFCGNKDKCKERKVPKVLLRISNILLLEILVTFKHFFPLYTFYFNEYCRLNIKIVKTAK